MAFLLPSLSVARNRIYSDTHLKEELTDLSREIPGFGIPYPPTHAEDGEHVANVCQRFKRWVCVVYLILSYLKKKIKTWLVSSAGK